MSVASCQLPAPTTHHPAARRARHPAVRHGPPYQQAPTDTSYHMPSPGKLSHHDRHPLYPLHAVVVRIRTPLPRNILLNNAVSKLVGWAITRPDVLLALDIDSELLELLGGGLVPRAERRRERVWGRSGSANNGATSAPPPDVAAERQYEDRVPFDPKVHT